VAQHRIRVRPFLTSLLDIKLWIRVRIRVRVRVRVQDRLGHA